MSTLNLQSTDKNVVFSSNLSPEDRTKTARTLPIEEFDYYYDWINSGYKISKNNSQHDMELLASYMVSRQEKETCTDSAGKQTQENILRDNEIGTQVLTCAEGETYKVEYLGYVIDTKKYKEFLKQFLEKKYYLYGEHGIEGESLREGETGDNQENQNNQNDNDNYVPNPAAGDFRSWTQCKQSWSNIVFPGSRNVTICDAGCLVTAISMQIARSGTLTLESPIDPGVVALKLPFSSGGALLSFDMKKIAPNFKYVTKLKIQGMSKETISNKLTNYDPNKYYMILAVSTKKKNKVHHYVALDYVDKTTNEIYMMDPYPLRSNSTKKLYDSYKVYEVLIFEKRD